MIDRRYSAEELRKMADDLDAFVAAMEELETCTVVFNGGPVRRWRIAQEGKEKAFEASKTKLARLTGPAQLGIPVTNTYYQVEGVARPINPVAAWQNCIQPKAIFGSEDIISAARTSAAILRNEAGPREREERSVAGRLASLIRWPSHVRELAGFPADSRAGRATQWTVGAILFAVVTGVVGSALWALIATAAGAAG